MSGSAEIKMLVFDSAFNTKYITQQRVKNNCDSETRKPGESKHLCWKTLGVFYTCGSISIALFATDEDVKAKNLIYRIDYTLLAY